MIREYIEFLTEASETSDVTHPDKPLRNVLSQKSRAAVRRASSGAKSLAGAITDSIGRKVRAGRRGRRRLGGRPLGLPSVGGRAQS